MKSIWIVVITVIITGGIVGGGGYYYLNSKATKEKNDLQAQIDDLNAKIKAAQTALSTDSSISTSTTAATEETASWKTYTNSAFGFSIKYPSDYFSSEASSFTPNDGVFINSSADAEGALVSVEAQSASGSLDVNVAGRTSDSSFSEATKTTLAGVAAYEGVSQGMFSSYGIIVMKGLNIVEIVFDTGNVNGLAKSKAALTVIQKQILSTFQFAK